MLTDQVIGEYLNDLASRSGTPGGGAAAAVTGAQAAGLMSMVCQLTRAGSAKLLAAGVRANTAQTRFLELADLDVTGFGAVMAAWKLPRAERDALLQAALRQACEAPLGMIREATALIDHLAVINREGNRNLVTDTAIAACLLESTMVAARLNVLINVNAMNTTDDIRSIQAELATMPRDVERVSQIRHEIEASLMPATT